MGVCAGAGAAIDTDGFDLVHAGLILLICHVAMQRKSVKAEGLAKAVEIVPKSGQNATELLPF
jgi:intracellular sulfur oxidation DsrE/DsrF family protein